LEQKTRRQPENDPMQPAKRFAVRDAHYDLDVAFDFLAFNGRRAREVGVVDPVHLADGINERRKVFEPSAAMVNLLTQAHSQRLTRNRYSRQ
jgi:hypothetical protein